MKKPETVIYCRHYLPWGGLGAPDACKCKDKCLGVGEKLPWRPDLRVPKGW